MCAAYQIRHSEFLAWDDDDRGKAIAWHLRQAQACSRCGTRPEEWDEDRGGDSHAYIGEVHRCHGCVVKDRTEESPEMKNGRGLHVVLVRNPERGR